MTRPPFQSAGRLIRYSAPSHTPSRTAGAWPHRPSQRRPPLRRRAARGEMLYRARRAQSSRRHPSHALARVPSCAGSRSSSPSLSSLPEEGRARIALLLDSHHPTTGSLAEAYAAVLHVARRLAAPAAADVSQSTSLARCRLRRFGPACDVGSLRPRPARRPAIAAGAGNGAWAKRMIGG